MVASRHRCLQLWRHLAQIVNIIYWLLLLPIVGEKVLLFLDHWRKRGWIISLLLLPERRLLHNQLATDLQAESFELLDRVARVEIR